VGEIKSLKLDNPRKIVAVVMLDNGAPFRKDSVGLEFQGLTGVAAARSESLSRRSGFFLTRRRWAWPASA
jgi:hypothetical protein